MPCHVDDQFIEKYVTRTFNLVEIDRQVLDHLATCASCKKRLTQAAARVKPVKQSSGELNEEDGTSA